MGLAELLLPVWHMPAALPESHCFGSPYDVLKQWFLGLSAAHVALFGVHRARYPDSTPLRGHMAAHLVAQACAFAYLCSNGWYLYLFGSFEDALTATHAGACQLGMAFAGFQLYDFLATLLGRSYGQRTKGFEIELVIHHAVAGLMSYGGCKFNTLEHFGLFYFGVSESSSIFLVGVDAFRQFPELPPAYPMLNGLFSTCPCAGGTSESTFFLSFSDPGRRWGSLRARVPALRGSVPFCCHPGSSVSPSCACDARTGRG